MVCSKEAKRKCTLHDHWCFWELNKVIFKNAGSLELLIASVWGRASRIKNRIESHMWKRGLAPVTPKSDQVQNSPAASPVMLHHTVSRTWLFTPRRLRGGSWGEKNWDGRRNGGEGGEGGETGEGRKTDLCFPARFLPFPSPAAVVSPSLSLSGFPSAPRSAPGSPRIGFWSLTQIKNDYTTNSHYLTYTFIFKGLRECTFWNWGWKSTRSHTLAHVRQNREATSVSFLWSVSLALVFWCPLRHLQVFRHASMTKANFLIKNELQLFTKEPELVNQIVKKDRKKADLSRVWKIVEQFEVRFHPELKSCENVCEFIPFPCVTLV